MMPRTLTDADKGWGSRRDGRGKGTEAKSQVNGAQLWWPIKASPRPHQSEVATQLICSEI